MKIMLLIAFTLAVFVTAAPAHPGKTDKYGGHKCLKDCEEWNLYYAEYHTHDKNGKPVRVAGKPKKNNAVNTLVSADTVAPAVEPLRTVQTVTVYQYVTVVREESGPFNPLLWILLVLLLLWLIYRLNRRKT